MGPHPVDNFLSKPHSVGFLASFNLNQPLVAAADQSRLMQEQMTGAAMAMPPDPNKAFKVSCSPARTRLTHLPKVPVLTLCFSVLERVGGAGDRGT